LGGGSNNPDEPDTPVHVGTPLAAPRHRWRDRLSAFTALSATRLASLSTKAKSGLLDSMMTSCFKALCTPMNSEITSSVEAFLLWQTTLIIRLNCPTLNRHIPVMQSLNP